MPKIRKLVDEVIVRNDAQSLDENEERPLDLSAPNSSTVSNVAESTILEHRYQEQRDENRLVDCAWNHEERSCGPTMQDQLIIVASTSSQQIRSLKLPSQRRTSDDRRVR